MTQTPNNLAAYIWSLADLLRGDFKQSQYGRIILPFTLLRRLECVLADSKEAVLAQVEQVQAMNVSEEAQESCCFEQPTVCLFTAPPKWTCPNWVKPVSPLILKPTFKAFQKTRGRFLSILSL